MRGGLAVADQLIPGDGVYAGRAAVGEEAYWGAISVGNAPTFGGAQRLVEAYLLDFEGDLYGESVRLEFDRWLRAQQTFASAETLAEQMGRDVAAVRRIAGNEAEIGKGPTA